MYSVIERGALIKLFRKSLLACIVAGALVMPAHAVTSTEIKQQIDAAIEKQNLAHQIAEVVCWRRYCWRHEFDFQHNEIYAGYYSAGLRHSCNYW